MVRGASGVAGSSATLRCAQDDRFVGGERERSSSARYPTLSQSAAKGWATRGCGGAKERRFPAGMTSQKGLNAYGLVAVTLFYVVVEDDLELFYDVVAL
jgi:hypothetical protein